MSGFETAASSQRHTLSGWLLRDLPYVILIVLALVGISWTNLSVSPSSRYWMAFAPIAAVICIVGGWRLCKDRSGRVRLVVTQLLQWAAIWFAMYLMMLKDVRGMLNDDGLGLTLLTLIALGVFISGIHTRIWQLWAVGIFLAAAVPVISWIEQGTVILLIAGIVLIGLIFAHWWFMNGRRRRSRSDPA